LVSETKRVVASSILIFVFSLLTSCYSFTLATTPSDATIAYKRAVLNAIKYLAKFGYTEEQVYLMLSCIPCEGRISGIVDVPNAVATLAIPLAIFDRDVRPPSSMDKVEQLAHGIRVLETNVCLSTEGGAVPYDPRLA
jgi:formamidase